MKHLPLIALLLMGCTVRQTAFDAGSQADYCHRKVVQALDELGDDYSHHARNIMLGQQSWNVRPNVPQEWCAGFWPGVLWYDYALTGDTAVLRAARGWTEALHDFAYQPVFDHDLGFEMIGSYLNGYRFLSGDTGPEAAPQPAVPGAEALAEGYRRVLLAAADSLATLYSPQAGTILSWPRHVADFGGHNTIMDNMINLELLLWASRHGGSDTLYHIALSHADTTMHYHFRPDGSSYHVAVYDTLTGRHLYNCTHQGAADESMWARGQSWAIYGYTTMYRYTRNKRYLDFAQQVTDVYLAGLPDDMVPYWDFSQTDYRDASTACVVASALIDLAAFVDGEKGRRYMDAAMQMMASLSAEPYRSGDVNASFLLHSVGNHPAGTEVDASIVYADYYYIEALWKLRMQTK